jgi:hypothetical protein
MHELGERKEFLSQGEHHPDLLSIPRLLAELGFPWRAEAPRER